MGFSSRGPFGSIGGESLAGLEGADGAEVLGNGALREAFLAACLHERILVILT